MATSKKPTKKPAKAKTPKGRSVAMSEHSRYDEPAEKADEELEEHEDAGEPTGPHPAKDPYTDAPAAPSLPPPHVSPQGSGAANSAAPRGRSKAHLDQEQQFVLIIAAILYTKPGPHTIEQAYQQAKNLVQTLLDDEPEDEEEPEPEPE